MSEHEIFNSDDEDVLVEITPVKTIYEKKENKGKIFFKTLFSFHFLPIALSILSILFELFRVFIMAFSSNNIANTVMFFFSLGLAISALIISIIPMIMEKKLVFNFQSILSAFAIFVVFL